MVTKIRLEPSFDADGIVVDNYLFMGPYAERPTEDVETNNLFWDPKKNASYYFDGTEWQPVGGGDNVNR